jgi:Tat protein translocase TatB subunit
MQPGIWEIIVILAVALIIVGPEKLPEVAKMVAKAMRDFRRYSGDLRREINQGVLGEARSAVSDTRHAIENAIEETIEETVEDAYPDASDFPGDGTDYDDYGTDYYGSKESELEEEAGSEPEETEDASGSGDESPSGEEGEPEPGGEAVEEEYEDDYGND